MASPPKVALTVSAARCICVGRPSTPGQAAGRIATSSSTLGVLRRRPSCDRRADCNVAVSARHHRGADAALERLRSGDARQCGEHRRALYPARRGGGDDERGRQHALLRADAQIARAYANNIERLATAFDSLYASLSETQKQAADTFFRQQAVAAAKPR
jgi:hypothetical protein